MEESLEQVQARHRKEQRDLQARITNKKKNATKKTRKFVNDECAELERQLRERQEEELRRFTGEGEDEGDAYGNGEEGAAHQPADGLAHRLQATTLTTTDTTASSQPTQTQQEQQQQQPQSQPDNQSPGLQQQQQQEQQQQQTPPPKQKRNRQRERLARRAAEQQAAAEAAAAEAAGMTDRRAVERAAMGRALAAHGLREHEIAPDGHCLFSAVADQLGENGLPVVPPSFSSPLSLSLSDAGAGAGAGVRAEGAGGKAEPGGGGVDGLRPQEADEPPYRTVRRAAAEWIAAHRDEYAGFLDEGVDGYARRIRDTAEWGGQLELSALANAYGVEIRVVQGDHRVEVIAPTSADAAGAAAAADGGGGGSDGERGADANGSDRAGSGEKKDKKTLWLAYYRHGYGLGEHYNSLRKAS